MLNVYVVEDEELARLELIYLLVNTGKVNIVGEAEDIHQALWEISEKQPDVVFLDIELENGNGMDLAKQFHNMKKQPMIVFVTAYDQYALAAFDLDAVDYIVKPIDEVRLLKAVNKLMKQNNPDMPVADNHAVMNSSETKSITVKDDGRMLVVDMNDIFYVGTENRQAYIKTAEHKYETDTLLYKIKEKLGDNFVQVHRGYIVNIKKISALEPWFNRTYLLFLKDGSKISVSRSYVKTIKRVLGL